MKPSTPTELLLKARKAYLEGDKGRANNLLLTIERNYSPSTYMRYRRIFTGWVKEQEAKR